MSNPWPKEWPKITAAKQVMGAPQTGFSTRFSRGSSELWLDEEYFLTVEAGDSLSAYSQILYGDFKQVNVWGRMTTGCNGYPEKLSDLIPITAINLIHTGETLVHAGQMLEAHKPYVKPPTPIVPPIYDFRPSPKVRTPTGVEIVAADKYDKSGHGEYLSTALGGGYVILYDIPSFVSGVQNAASGRQISILHIQVHGAPGEMMFGNGMANGDMLNAGLLPRHRPDLLKLKPLFAPDAWVVLRSCDTGKDLAFIRQIRSLWDVNILAGTGDWYNVADFNDGMYVILQRDGAEYYSGRLPDQLQHSMIRKAWRNW